MKKGFGLLVLVALIATFFALPVTAAPSYTLFGNATLITPGHNSQYAVKLDSSTAPLYGGIDFAVPAGTTFANIQNLSTDYMFTHNSCGAGSPRFQINVDGKNAFVYIGPPPNYTNCPPNVWLNTGNLATPANFVDTGQLPGGTFYDTFAHADTLYGTHLVTGIQLVADGGETVQVDNVVINGQTYTFEPTVPTNANQCKNGGYKNFTDPSTGKPFKNQGQCVSFVENHGKNGGDHQDGGGNDQHGGND